MQVRVAANFNQLVTPCWRKIDAARPIDEVRADAGAASSPPRRSPVLRRSPRREDTSAVASPRI